MIKEDILRRSLAVNERVIENIDKKNIDDVWSNGFYEGYKQALETVSESMREALGEESERVIF